MNLAALISEEEKRKPNEDSESDDDDAIHPKQENRKLFDHWVILSNDNLKLLKDKVLLEAQVNILEMERSTENFVHVPLKDKGLQHQGTTEDKRISELESKVIRLAELLCLEEEKNMNLEENLTENHMRI